jgi:dihydroceramidase
MANTFSNLFTVGLALLGSREVKREGLPMRYVLGYWVRALLSDLGSLISTTA